MKSTIFFTVSVLVVSCFAQRSPYAGRLPIGYPIMDTTSTTASDLDNRFGEDVPVTTERLPIEANGDRELVNRLKKLPIDQQPFWLINWLHLEQMRQNPQTYQSKPNTFIDLVPSQNNQNINGQLS